MNNILIKNFEKLFKQNLHVDKKESLVDFNGAVLIAVGECKDIAKEFFEFKILHIDILNFEETVSKINDDELFDKFLEMKYKNKTIIK